VIQQVIDGKLPYEFSLGELQRKNLSGLKGEQAAKALELLEQYGWVKLTQSDTSKGGRPTTICRAHPKVEYFSKGANTPLTILTKPIKRGFSEFSEGGRGAILKINPDSDDAEKTPDSPRPQQRGIAV